MKAHTSLFPAVIRILETRLHRLIRRTNCLEYSDEVKVWRRCLSPFVVIIVRRQCKTHDFVLGLEHYFSSTG